VGEMEFKAYPYPVIFLQGHTLLNLCVEQFGENVIFELSLTNSRENFDLPIPPHQNFSLTFTDRAHVPYIYIIVGHFNRSHIAN
jgi:hypothetical protein